MAAALDRAARRLVDALAAVDSDGDGVVDPSEMARLFESGMLSARDAEILFRTTDPAEIFRALDRNADGRVAYDEIMRFVDARNVGLTAHHGGVRAEPGTVAAFLAAVLNTLLLHLRRMSLHPEDRDRTVPIDTDYVATADFDLEADDRRFLLACGRRATEAFLRAHRGQKTA
jgi:arachidonate 5-lipoxygenase